MKLRRIYSNKPELFTSVDFTQGLNIVLAEIRLPENRTKDTHNLGKTTLGRLIDYCLLLKKNKDFFLFKFPELFDEFVFFVEIELADSSFLTIRRSVNKASKASFKKSYSPGLELVGLPDGQWDHWEIPFERAVTMLDGLLDWQALKPWTFRNGLGYLLRSQDDYHDVFHLSKFAGKHSGWKPFLAHLLGFDSELIGEHYKTEEEIEEAKRSAITIEGELGGSIQDISKIEGLLMLKQREVRKKQNLLDAFDFRSEDIGATNQLVEEIDHEIAQLNAERYSLNHNQKKIAAALAEERIQFSTEEAVRLFSEVEVHFEGQIKKDFQQLLAFNRAITDEREGYLKEEGQEIAARLKEVNSRLDKLGARRSDILAFLGDTDIFRKYKSVSKDIVTLGVDIESLERQRGFLHRLQELRSKIRALEEKLVRLRTKIEDDVENKNSNEESLFGNVRVYFSEIVEEVIDRQALLSAAVHKKTGHLEFKAEIVDERGAATGADDGHTYKKLLCIAFDLAFLRVHMGSKFPRFVFHDGVFESLDDRKKTNLLAVFRRYATLGIQPIITMIDSDMPPSLDGEETVLEDDEIVLALHDEGEQGRLFKMATW